MTRYRKRPVVVGKPVRVQCDTCLHWRPEDPIEKVSNVGVCKWALQQGDGFYDRPQHVPFWARELLTRTVSWQGEGCPTWTIAATYESEEQP